MNYVNYIILIALVGASGSQINREEFPPNREDYNDTC